MKVVNLMYKYIIHQIYMRRKFKIIINFYFQSVTSPFEYITFYGLRGHGELPSNKVHSENISNSTNQGFFPFCILTIDI